MGEWSSYALTDFLMFTPAIYFRQYELVNAVLWPWQVALQLAAFVAIWVSLRERGAGIDWGSVLLVPAWAVCGWWFLHRHYAPINLAADPIALAFALQALLLSAAALRAHARPSLPLFHALPGLLLFAYALLVHPMLGVVNGREWSAVEFFGVAPDPTALATLGIVLTMDLRRVIWLAPIPLAWCVISGLTYLAMDLNHGLLTPALAIVAVGWRVLSGSPVRRAEG